MRDIINMIYTVTYLDYGITQKKLLIPHSIYEGYKNMPYDTKEEQSAAKSWLKNKTKGREWFTNKSPYYEAIKTGVLNCNGKHRVKIEVL